jgi:putative glutamine amidotransferase
VDHRPIIGVAGAGYVVPRFWGELPVRGVPTSYVDAVAAAGGRPMILPPGHATQLLDVLDAVVLAGGDDIGADPARDKAEIALVQAARERELPLLGVCRGLQLLAVADGGTLVADLGPDLPHVRPEVGHPVDVAAGSVLGSLLGSGSVVSSLHHQGVATLGADSRATAWSADGLVEGAEWGDRTVGVQWHPELDASGPALFRWLTGTAGQAAV